MSEVPIEEIGRILPSLTEREWTKLGGQQELSPKQMLAALQDTFGRDFP
ncbi:MAG: hypothetical protein VX948_11615 [Candidatus Latescibacterota bacterium]|nr:hypothetical protein [Candidatus Latescibacterota bacterium]|tara:strand:+ start:803 stop:949 length:147 start_codon:yes stop_codon:yes gene_type:complete